jgi:PTS system nitrogen regulatory IIA component
VDLDGGFVHGKVDALRLLSSMLAPAVGVPKEQIEKLLTEREAVQSTGIGDGVGIPHAFIDSATRQEAALLLCPLGVPFDAIDGKRCTILFGVVGPRRPGEHLKILARISRMLRDGDTRSRLAHTADAEAAYQLILSHDEAMGAA